MNWPIIGTSKSTLIHLGVEACLLAGCVWGWSRAHSSQVSESATKSALARVESQRQTLAARVSQLQQVSTQVGQVQDSKVTLQTISKPDGTRVVTETHEKVTAHESSTNQTLTSQTSTQVKVEQESAETQTHEASHITSVTVAPLSRYSLDLSWSPARIARPAADPTWMPASASLGARLGDLPLWLTLGAQRDARGRTDALLGLRLEF